VRANYLRQLLNENKPTLGTHANMDNPTIIELIGHSGQFDYVEFVAEYGPYDLHSLENLGRAIDLFPNFSGMIKVEQEPRTFITVRAIGSGIQNVLYADVHNAAEARACIRATRAEHPERDGMHGVGMRRDVGYVLGGGMPWVEALDNTVVCLMIEKAECVENLESVLDVPGVDMVQFGPGDYSLNIGVPGVYGPGGRHPKVAEAEKYTIETAIEKGIRPRVELGNPAAAKPYLDMGVRDFCIGWDVQILYTWFRDNGKAMKELVSNAEKNG
jgi:4-hydroxy-2-oxoheptanedioate aldolase